jgi:hypothetical protein
MQYVAGGLEVGDLRGLVLAVGHHRQDVDDGLGREGGHGGRSNVFNLKCPFA